VESLGGKEQKREVRGRAQDGSAARRQAVPSRGIPGQWAELTDTGLAAASPGVAANGSNAFRYGAKKSRGGKAHAHTELQRRRVSVFSFIHLWHQLAVTANGTHSSLYPVQMQSIRGNKYINATFIGMHKTLPSNGFNLRV